MKTPEEMAEEFSNWFVGERRKTIAKKSWYTGFEEGLKFAKDSASIDTNSIDKGTRMQWISVKDRLPEIDKYVLITHRISQDYTSLKVMEACRNSDDQYEIWGGHAILADYVDYWMPLPEAPKEEK